MGLLACGAGARQPGERLPLGARGSGSVRVRSPLGARGCGRVSRVLVRRPLGARGSGQVRGVVPLAFGYLSSRLGEAGGVWGCWRVVRAPTN